MPRPYPPLVLTIHGINSDGTWQDEVEEVLTGHCRCLAYRYRDYRYAGFTVQFFSPFWGLATVLCLGAWIALLRSPDGSVLAWKDIAFAYVHSVLGLVFLGWAMKEAVEWPTSARRRRRFVGMMLLGAAVLITTALNPVAPASPWFWPLSVFGVGLVLISLLELWHPLPIINGANAVLLPLGALGLTLALGMGIGTNLRASAMFYVKSGHFLTSSWFGPVAACLFGVIFFVIAWWKAKTRRAKRVEDLRKWIQERVSDYKDDLAQKYGHVGDDEVIVHVIAHSFGTFLFGQILKDEAKGDRPAQRIRVDRVILVGSVLDTDFAWDKLSVVDGERPVRQVRNEAGGRDRVVEWAGRTQLWPFKGLLGGIGFGAAGRLGFISLGVHNVNNSLDYCEACRTREERAVPRVHNVHLPFFHHSDAFAAFERAERFWLPFLLAIDPWEYWEFRRLCAKAMAYGEILKGCANQIENIDRAQQVSIRNRNLAAKAAESQRAEKENQFKAELEKNANERLLVTRRVEAVNLELGNLERQLGEQVWDWAYVSQSGNVRFSDFVTTAIAEELFTRDPEAADNGGKRDETLRRAEGLSPKVIKGTWGLVVESLQDVAKLKARKLTVHQQPLSESDRQAIARLNPYRALADAVLSELPPP